MTDIEWRSLSGEQIVDICEAGREELERRRNEAMGCLELAFGPREAAAPKPGRPLGSKNKKADETNGNGHLSARQQQLAEAEAAS